MSADDEGFTDMNPPADCEGGFSAVASGRAAQVIQIDNGKALNVVAICAAFCGFCLGVSIWSAYTARDAATEARLAQYELSQLRSDHDSLARRVKEIE
jgi:hypothetical protein